MKRLSKLSITLIIFFSVLIFINFLLQPIRLFFARIEADQYAESLNLEMEPAAMQPAENKTDLLANIRDLAVWEEKTRGKLNDVFDQYWNYDYQSRNAYEDVPPNPFHSRDVYLRYAKYKKWEALQDELNYNTRTAIDMIFSSAPDGVLHEISGEEVQKCYKYGRFSNIAKMETYVAEGNYEKAYQTVIQTSFHSSNEWAALPLDIAFYLHPQEIVDGLSQDLNNARILNHREELNLALEKDQAFQERYANGPYTITATGREELCLCCTKRCPEIG